MNLVLGTNREGKREDILPRVVRSLRKRLQHAYDIAVRKFAEVQETRKAYYGLKSRGAVVHVGDRESGI